MNKTQTRVTNDTLKVFLSMAMMYDDTGRLLKTMEEGTRKDAIIDAAFLGHSLMKMMALSTRMTISPTHLKAFIKDPEKYFEWQMEGIKLAQPRLDESMLHFIHLGDP